MLSWGPWLRGIALRCYLDQRRAAQRPSPTVGLDANAWPDPRQSQVEAQLDLERALEDLAECEREVLLRFHRDGESVKEIADSLGLPVGTVKSQLHRGRRKLAKFDMEQEAS